MKMEIRWSNVSFEQEGEMIRKYKNVDTPVGMKPDKNRKKGNDIKKLGHFHAASATANLREE